MLEVCQAFRRDVRMTALKPLENLNVRSVRASRYPINDICAQPECTVKRDGRKGSHHIFPRSLIAGQSWFVSIGQQSPIPHVSWLCPEHHDDVEMHRAWIKLEDGEFVWYVRTDMENTILVHPDVPFEELWRPVGPLNPQPGSREGKPKRKKFRGEARRKRKTISIRVPQDEQEDGAGIFEDYIEQCKDALEKEGLDRERPLYYCLVDVMQGFLMEGRSGV